VGGTGPDNRALKTASRATNGAAAKLRTQGSHNYMQRRGESKVSKFALICFSIYHLHVVSGIKRE